MKSVLFLCTGNYYRSRLAEILFNHLAQQSEIRWRACSRGLRITGRNVGPISPFTLDYCRQHGLDPGEIRLPLDVAEADLDAADQIIALKEAEHRPLLRDRFPDWESRVEFWNIHDLDCQTPDQALPLLAAAVRALADARHTEISAVSRPAMPANDCRSR